MLNFRKLRQDFSSSILKEGKELYDKSSVVSAKIVSLDLSSIRLSSKVRGAFENVYESEIEIDRSESIAVDSNCDCTYTYDCQHIAALLYHLECNLDKIVVNYSQEADVESDEEIDDEDKKHLLETFEQAATKEEVRQDEHCQKEVLREYVGAATHLAGSPFFLKPEVLDEDQAELAIIFIDHIQPEFQLAIRLPSRSKPLYISNVKQFLDAIRFKEPISLSGKRYFLTPFSFSSEQRELLAMLINHARFASQPEERLARTATLDRLSLGALLARAFDLAMSGGMQIGSNEKELPLPALYTNNLEEPLCFSTSPAHIKCTLEYLEVPAPTLMINPSIQVDDELVSMSEVALFDAAKPGLLFQNTYFRFHPQIKRVHLHSLEKFQELTIPKPLFGTFIENALPVLRNYAEVTNPNLIGQFTTLPFVAEIKGRCVIHYLNGELEAEFYFVYGKFEVPAALSKTTYDEVAEFVSQEGVLARNLVEEKRMLEALFDDFFFDEKEGLFRVKSEKKIVEFMTEVIPAYQDRVEFECPENLSEQFIYDETSFELHFRESESVDSYLVELKVDGYLSGTKVDLLWDCIASKKRFVELNTSGAEGRKKSKLPRILVLDLEKLAPLVQIFDEIGLDRVDTYVQERPLWSLTTIQASQFKSLPVKFSMSRKLMQLRKQMLGETSFSPQPIPSVIQASLRNYQLEGVHWLERLRTMHLGGILADDMGLGKTLQAIIGITQSKLEKPDSQSLIVCPTSLVYNWQEEFHKFNPELNILVIDGVPTQRKKLLKKIKDYDVVVTSYNLMQKDVECYKEIRFDYVVLDEAQHIKNRGTRNAKSVKMLQAAHRLVLTGTPIENSLEELWSLFDFLMPGLLSSFDRFLEKYIRNCGHTEDKSSNIELLRKKVAPFMLRRMKEDVLQDLPPVSNILYHCHLTDVQRELYNSYAASAKKELSQLVKKEGFEKIQIHVLATLTRLKQICCHPAIFAKEKPEPGDSAKYDMLMELLPSLIEGKHKTVIFSQYTKMLTILKEDLEGRGITFSYLDGSSKNRLSIVKEFNESPQIPIFLVSLKAGGSGLNLVGADTVVHYDMWWNPAVENQATDRVYRLGQKKSVSSYKMVTLNTIEEKILNLQNRKKGLVKKVMSSDDEAISKLTWEEVLELLQT